MFTNFFQIITKNFPAVHGSGLCSAAYWPRFFFTCWLLLFPVSRWLLFPAGCCCFLLAATALVHHPRIRYRVLLVVV